MLSNRREIHDALRLVGELLAAEGASFAIVILGGAALNLLGVISRSTTDVDIVAFASERSAGGAESARQLHPPPQPMPEPLLRAARTVARDIGLDPDWLNAGPALQWRVGLPPGLETRVHWHTFGGLTVGLVDRYDLVFFKLFAAADAPGPTSVHYQDLIALRPTVDELQAAEAWVATQDASDIFAELLQVVVRQLHEDLGHA
jgi:hypothetical protein